MNRHQQFGGSKMILILGASGSGKSSLLRAGLVPRLRRNQEHWIVLDPFRPRQDPVSELAMALATALEKARRPESPESIRLALRYDCLSELNRIAEELRRAPGRREATLLIVIDQIEEMLGPAAPAASAALLSCLRSVAGARDTGIMVAGTLRSDFLGDLQNHTSMREARFDSLSVGPMSPACIAQVIEQPARKAGSEIQPEVVQGLIADTEKENALPLLAFALSELWKNRRGNVTVDDYAKLGGISGSIAKVARDVFDASNLSEAQQADLRLAFLRMVRINDGGQFARKVVHLKDMPESVRPVLDRFVNARLLVTHDSVIEVAHEAIFKSWDLLKSWLNQDREFLLWRKRLEDRLKSDTTLLRGPALAEARRWLRLERARLTEQEAKFIADSIKAADRQRMRTLAIVSGVIVVLAGAAIYSIIQQRETAKALAAAQQEKNQRFQDNVQFTWTALTTRPCTEAQARSVLGRGLRRAYCEAAPYLGFSRLTALSGLPVFIGGPHDNNRLNLDSGEFGHYNKAFVVWAREHLIPLKPDKITRDVYEKYGRRTARLFLLSHHWLRDHPADLRSLTAAYRSGTKVSLEGEPLNQSKYWKYGMAVNNNPEVAGGPEVAAYAVCTAIGFWARREVDGTAAEFYEGLVKLLDVFDGDFLRKHGH